MRSFKMKFEIESSDDSSGKAGNFLRVLQKVVHIFMHFLKNPIVEITILLLVAVVRY